MTTIKVGLALVLLGVAFVLIGVASWQTLEGAIFTRSIGTPAIAGFADLPTSRWEAALPTRGPFWAGAGWATVLFGCGLLVAGRRADRASR